MGCGSSAPAAQKDQEDQDEAAKKKKREDEDKEAAKKKKEEEDREAAKKKKEEEDAANAAAEAAAKQKADDEAAHLKAAADELERQDTERIIFEEILNKKKYAEYEKYIENPEKEKILLSSIFGKHSPGLGGFQNRLLIFTNRPCIYYVDMVTQQTKGDITWYYGSGTRTGELKDQIPEASKDSSASAFKVVVETDDGRPRVYFFKDVPQANDCDVQSSIEEWVAKIQFYKEDLKKKDESTNPQATTASES